MERSLGYDTNLGYFNLEAARAHEQRTALIDLSCEPPRRVTHGELNRRMDQVAATLVARGLREGDRVLLAMSNRSEFVEVFFGAMRAGLVPVPLNIKLSRETIAYVVEDAACRAAVIEASCHPHLTDVADDFRLEPRIALDPPPPGWEGYEPALASATADRVEPVAPAPEQVSFITYTSGSTGRPKGVLMSHVGLMWAIETTQRWFPSGPDDCALVAGPLYHKNAMRGSIKPKLSAGGSAVILPRFEPRAFLRALADYGCTHATGVPAMFRLLLQQRDLLETLRFPRLRSISVGSDVVDQDLLDALEHAFGVRAREIYGITEVGGPLAPPVDGRTVPSGSCGVAAPGVELKLLGSNGQVNESEGELWIRSPAAMLGYLNMPDLNRKRLVDGWYKTGDLFARDSDGFYFFQGRTDDLFVCGGENIYPREVELVLHKHPDVMEAVVHPFPHSIKGMAPAALVALRPRSTADEDSLKKFCLANGPAYAHPRRVVIVPEIPMGGTGKVDRKAARDLLAALMGPSGMQEAG